MLRSSADITGYSVEATDGTLGSVADLYFDDDAWVMRYVIVDAGNWISGRLVLISPISVAHADWVSRRLAVTLTREQVRSSPSIDTQHPVSRQQEQQHLRHYGYPYYWVGPALWGTMPVPHADPPTPANTEPDHQSTHLRSCVEVAGYQLDATDGTLGHIADFLFDDLDWAIRWLVVDTSNWWFGHKVLISPDWVDGVDWIEQMVHIAVVRDDVQRAPEYDAVEHVNRQWEVDCYAHHKRPPYWISADDARRSKKRRLRPPVVTK